MKGWGSAEHHDLTVRRLDKPLLKRCLSCPTGKRKRITHAVLANGVCLASGCEFHAYKHARAMRKERRP